MYSSRDMYRSMLRESVLVGGVVLSFIAGIKYNKSTHRNEKEVVSAQLFVTTPQTGKHDSVSICDIVDGTMETRRLGSMYLQTTHADSTRTRLPIVALDPTPRWDSRVTVGENRKSTPKWPCAFEKKP